MDKTEKKVDLLIDLLLACIDMFSPKGMMLKQEFQKRIDEIRKEAE